MRLLKESHNCFKIHDDDRYALSTWLTAQNIEFHISARNLIDLCDVIILDTTDEQKRNLLFFNLKLERIEQGFRLFLLDL